MSNLILTIDLLPRGAWGRDLSKTLPKKDWDVLREYCYDKSRNKCAICGCADGGLHAHEIWEFDIVNKTQTLVDIIALCSACHGVKHYRNSLRIGYGMHAKEQFMKVNKCSELTFAAHLSEAGIDYYNRSKILRWQIIAELNKFGGAAIKYVQKKIPLISDPYHDVNWLDVKHLLSGKFENKKISDNEFVVSQHIKFEPLGRRGREAWQEKSPYYISHENNELPPKLCRIIVDNHAGIELF